ncbi:MAG: M20/M25/M40 family metallo-hydrolase [Actinobacteria bacterium]|nr:M20/M25/M40 family metallo-hydrolase [Actinomycetota bacterium]
MTLPPGLEAARRHRGERGWEVLADFIDLLRIPNVIGSTGDLRRNAEDLAERFRRREAVMEVVEGEGAGPVVIGELRCASPTATLGVYVHYDGQPVAPDEWTTDPFAAAIATAPWHEGGTTVDPPGPGDPIDPEWRIYARGASDDKTPFAAILAAVDALAEAGIERRIDLVFLFDGEEESGSPNLGRYMTELAPRLVADAWLLCDGPVHQSRLPQVAFGVRGYTGFELTVYGPDRELHSGHYGNWVPNPAQDLARLLAGCKDETGRVVIDGFYDDTLPVADSDRSAIAAMPPVEKTLREELGFAAVDTDDSHYVEALLRPTFNVRGLRAASVGREARNVIPAEATASVDIRLAAGDDPHRMLDRVETHLRNQGWHVLDREPTPEERRAHRRLARMVRDPGYRAVRVPMGSALAAELVAASRTASGQEVVALPTFGGSLPLYLFEDHLDAPVVILPIANHDNNQHAADENVRVANLWYGVDLWATLLGSDLGGLAKTR